MATTKKAPGKSLAPAKKAPARRGPVTDVVAADLVITDVPTIAQVKEAVKSGGKLYWDGESDGSSILAGALENATSGMDLFASSDLEKMSDHLGETLSVLSIDGVHNSDHADAEGGLGVYLIVSFADQDGAVFRMAVGATDPVAKIVALNELGELPWPVAFERSPKATRNGFYPINCLSRRGADGIDF